MSQIAGYDIQDVDDTEQWGIYIRKPRRAISLIKNYPTEDEAFTALAAMKESESKNLVDFQDEDPFIHGFYMKKKDVVYIIELLAPVDTRSHSND